LPILCDVYEAWGLFWQSAPENNILQLIWISNYFSLFIYLSYL
jgi:hypothetical protein